MISSESSAANEAPFQLDKVISVLCNNESNAKSVEEALYSFVNEYNESISYPEISSANEVLVDTILSLIQLYSKYDEILKLCLMAIKILSRDKKRLQSIVTPDMISFLVKEGCVQITDEPKDIERVTEAQKCLSNLIMTSPFARGLCCKNGCMDGLFSRLKCFKDPNFTNELKYYYMELLFLLTALEPKHSFEPCTQFHGITYLTEIVMSHYVSDVRLTCKALKTMFNVTAHASKKTLDEEEDDIYRRLTSQCREILVAKYDCEDDKLNIQTDVINLLTNVPPVCYDELLTDMDEVSVEEGVPNKDIEYDGKDMTAVHVALEFLSYKFDLAEKAISSQLLELTPVLMFLYGFSKNLDLVRKYCRSKVLPPLRDVSQKPEEGEMLRSKLVRLMTSPVTQVAELSSEFLFVLCKESASRLIKYTGYGNAAGLLARKNLLTGTVLPQQAKGYSSESDYSDTEEYEQALTKMNPVTGRMEPPRPSVTMTDAEKEEETAKLLSALDKMARIERAVHGDREEDSQ